MITSISIKMFFRMKTNQHIKPRIKNTISFKRLNILYSLGLIVPALMQAVLMRNESKDTYVLYYTVSLVLNSMLLSLFLADKEAIGFFKHKLLLFKEDNIFINLQKLNVFRINYKVGPLAGEELETGTEINAPDDSANNEVIAIDIDGRDL